MKTICVDTFSFSELLPEAKEKAIEKLRYINVEHPWWEGIYDYFDKIASSIGFQVELKKTYFSGFYHQGQGSSFFATVNISQMADGLQNQKWREHINNVFGGVLPTFDKRLIRLHNGGKIDIIAMVIPARERSVKLTFKAYYQTSRNLSNIENALSNLESYIEQIALELNHLLFYQLREEYEYLTSDPVVSDTIENTEYDFRADGTIFF